MFLVENSFKAFCESSSNPRILINKNYFNKFLVLGFRSVISANYDFQFSK